jgi:hypothetical protein
MKAIYGNIESLLLWKNQTNASPTQPLCHLQTSKVTYSYEYNWTYASTKPYHPLSIKYLVNGWSQSNKVSILF